MLHDQQPVGQDAEFGGPPHRKISIENRLAGLRIQDEHAATEHADADVALLRHEQMNERLFQGLLPSRFTGRGIHGENRVAACRGIRPADDSCSMRHSHGPVVRIGLAEKNALDQAAVFSIQHVNSLETFIRRQHDAVQHP